MVTYPICLFRPNIAIKPEILRILRHDSWGTYSVFIVDLNANKRRGFTNLVADYQKLRLEIGVGIYGNAKRDKKKSQRP